MPEFKLCACCKISKPVAEFYGRSASPDGLNSYCKLCKHAKCRIHYAELDENEKAALLSSRKEYYIKNRARALAYSRAWNKSHPNRKKSSPNTSPERRKEHQRRAYIKRRLDPAKVNKDREHSKLWAKSNPDKIKNILHRRRVRELDGAQDCTDRIRLLRKERFCHWCCTKMRSAECNVFMPNDRTIDHVIPISKGGGHIPENLVACCRKCNSSRNDKFVNEWTWELAE